MVTAGMHRNNPAERAIQTLKGIFKSTREGAHPDFPAKCWDLLLPQVVVIANLVWASWINPAISAYTQVHGVFDYNDIPMAPAGTKVVVFDNTKSSLGNDNVDGFYVGPAPGHYRNYTCYTTKTKALRHHDSIRWYPHVGTFPFQQTDSAKLQMILTDLVDHLKNPNKILPFNLDGTTANTAIRTINEIFTATPDGQPQNSGAPLITTSPPTEQGVGADDVPDLPPPTQLHPIGVIVRKKYNDGFIEGEITAYDSTNSLYKIKLRDGNTEYFTPAEVNQQRKQRQHYSRVGLGVPAMNIPDPTLPSIKRHQRKRTIALCASVPYSTKYAGASRYLNQMKPIHC